MLSGGAMSQESFEFKDGTSNKFWTICLEGTSFTVNFGKIGTPGQTQTKTFDDENEAKTAYDKLVAEKVKKGYVQVPGSAPSLAARSSNVVAFKFASDEAGSDDEPKIRQNKKGATALAEKSAGEELESGSSLEDKSDLTAKQINSEERINLRPEDYMWCSWLPRVVNLRKPEPPPFDRDTVLKRFSDMSNDGYKWIPALRKKISTPVQLSREEAEFWWRAVDKFTQMPGANVASDRETNMACKMTKEKLFEYLQTVRLSGDITTADMDRLFNTSAYYTNELTDQLAFLLCALCPPWDLVQYASGQYEDFAFCIMHQFREMVLPYLPDKDVDFLRNWVRPQLSPSDWTSAPKQRTRVKTLYLVASFLGMSSEVENLLATWSDGCLSVQSVSAHSEYPQALVLSLPSAEQMMAEARRLQMTLVACAHIRSSKVTPAEIFLRAWLAATGTQGLEFIVHAIARASYSKDDAEKRFKILALVENREVVPSMIELLASTLASHFARTWLETHPSWSAPELLKICAEKTERGERAREILQNIRHLLQADSVAQDVMDTIQQMFQSPEDTLPVMDETTMPSWLKTALAENKPGKVQLPEWVPPVAVPAMIVDKRKLASQQMELVLGALKKSTLENIHPLIQSLKKNLEPRNGDRCVWWLFDKWLKAGAPPKEKWAMLSLGLLGSDETAMKLTPLIRQWPGESQHARAVTGLECLRQMGTDTALMQINGIAQKVQFKGLKQKAMECMEHIARERGFTRQELEDRIVPDCGLNERGQRVFDFGPRKFSFVLSGELKAMVQDEDGKVKADLPKPNSKDDGDKAQKAVADWKLLKQQIKEIAKVQGIRLEQAMVTGRRWNVSDFQNLLVKHPLMINIVRLLVWGSFDMEGILQRTFRITEDQTLADENDKLLALEEHADIGIVHPLHMSAELRAQWGEMLSDYNIIAPFPQLARAIYHLDQSEITGTEITRFAEKIVPAISIVSTLEKQGWERGPVGDGGSFNEHLKYFPDADITAIAEYDYIIVGMIMDSHAQDIKRCHFERGRATESSRFYSNSEAMVPLEFVDSIVISEVLADLTALTAKAIE